MRRSSTENPVSLVRGDALILVDVQTDFLPGGNLSVPDGNQILPSLNAYLTIFKRQGLPVFATRDWHPEDHCSFQSQGGDWPAHCVAETAGAEFAPGLDLPSSAQIISKAVNKDQDAYSGFAGTDLESRLQSANIRRLFIGGLATDYCVLNTVKDALGRGFEVYLLQDAIRAVDRNPEDGTKALQEMVRLGSRTCSLEDLYPAFPEPGALLTDLYQLTMMQTYFDQSMNDTAVFEFYVRNLPRGRGFLVFAGLEQVLHYLETLRFTPQEIDWMKSCGRFSAAFIESLAAFRFTGDVHAMPEGTVFFANEPVLRIVAPLPQAQLVETRIINLLQYQILIASKAARMSLAAPGKILIDFGLRRAHGAEAGLMAARASYLAGFAGTSAVEAQAVFDIPLFGTMAHSFIQAHDDETQAFENFARSHPDNVILLLDTYDSLNAAHKVVSLASKLRQAGIAIKGVRLDSGNLGSLARGVRTILDEGGLTDVLIFASGDLDEDGLRNLSAAPIDGFGIGTRLTTSQDAPSLECVYKLQEYAGKGRRKLSANKSTLPGKKQVFREMTSGGRIECDIVTLAGEKRTGKALILPCMQHGQRLHPPEPLSETRARTAKELESLPDTLRLLQDDASIPVKRSDALQALADQSL